MDRESLESKYRIRYLPILIFGVGLIVILCNNWIHGAFYFTVVTVSCVQMYAQLLVTWMPRWHASRCLRKHENEPLPANVVPLRRRA